MSCEKLCVFCTNWVFDGGEPDYSELTPGYAGYIDCAKRRFEQVKFINLGSPREFRQVILAAKTCPDYDQVKV